MLSWLSCEKFCQNASYSRDGALKWYQWPQYGFHYLLCMSCRRYRRQVDTMEHVVHTCGSELCEPMEKEEEGLSESASMRIKKALMEQAAQKQQ